MPAYEHYLPGLYESGPGSRKVNERGEKVDVPMIKIDENRMPVLAEAL